MRKRTRDITLLLLAATLMAAIVLHQAMTQKAQQARDKTIANLETPKQVQFYQDLAATTPNPTPDEDPSTPQPKDDPCGTPHQIMTQWSELFEEAPEWTEDYLFWETYILFEPTAEPPLPFLIEVTFDLVREQSRTMLYNDAEAMIGFLDQVRTLAPCGAPLYPLAFPEVYEEPPPHWYGGLSKIVSLLRADARVAAKQGDFPRVVANLIAVLQIADALASEPLFEAQQRRYELYWRMAYLYKRIHTNAPLLPEYLAQLSTHLAQAHHREGLHVALAAQSNKTVHAYESWRKTSFIDHISRPSIYWGTRAWLWTTPLCEPFFLEDERTAIEFSDRVAAIPNAPIYKIQTALEKIKVEIDALPITRNYAKKRIPWFLNDAFPRQARHEINVDLWRLRLLAQRYQAETGALPQTLQQAADHFQETLPIDPSNGQPYSYQPDGDCYLLTSTGIELVNYSKEFLDRFAQLCPKNTPPN